jgi:phenylpropionate dioxygenase-like ring-hydroxylating dioxygenase large terminal subunit
MLTPEENTRLTRVGPGTPMGEAFRRYWIPALLGGELPEPDGPPVRVRLLGEDLIAFRDTEGNVGLVDAFCPHRRAPMFFGRNEECGLRCVYHGWKFDRNGTCVDMPSEPPVLRQAQDDNWRKTNVRITAYPTYEAGGFVWTYMGPREHQPPYPDYEFLRAPETHRYPSKTLEECNWLQALEGGVDSSHATMMHNMNIGDLSWLRDYEATVPRLELERTDYGFSYSGVRTFADHQWVRIYHFVMPSIQMRGTIQGADLQTGYIPRIDGHLWIPIDDENTWVFNFMYSYDPAVPLSREEAHGVETRAGRGPDDLTPDYRSKRNKYNDYLIDRQLQKTISFTGIKGVNTQDFALQEAMGPIVDRSKEHLGTTDRAVIVTRQLLLEATRAVERGESPLGADPRTARGVRPVDHRIPRELDWRVALRGELVARY